MSKRVYEQKKLDLLAHQAVTHPAYVIGSAFPVAGAHEITVYLYHALVEAAANTNPGRFILQGSPSDDRDWFDLAPFASSIGTPATEALTATEPAGEVELAVTSTTGFVARDSVYVENAQVDLGEWHVVEAILSTPNRVQLTEGLDGEQDSNSVLWGLADKWVATVSLRGVQRIRVVYDHRGATAANSHVKATGILVPSLIG